MKTALINLSSSLVRCTGIRGLHPKPGMQDDVFPSKGSSKEAIIVSYKRSDSTNKTREKAPKKNLSSMNRKKGE